MLAALFAAAPLKNVLSQSFKDKDGNPIDKSSSGIPYDPLANYTKATFISYLNSIFQLHTVFGLVAVTLLKVNDMTAPKGGECFSLLFRGGARALKQDTYTLDHSALGTFQLFLVPVGTDDNGAQGYLATINRLSYSQALASPAPTDSGSTKRSGSLTTTTTPTPTPTPTPTATLANASPSPNTPAQPEAPAITKPAAKPKPTKIKKPLWKQNDDDDFDGFLIN
jgi:hypothetical protein